MWRKAIFSFSTSTLILISFPSFAGLTDYMRDSLNNIDENLAIKYYETQERGYLLGGSWHYRVPNMVIYPFSITPPSIKASCGAIDIIMGGFSYVRPEYLVQFLQNLIQTAPAVAFEIALDTFAPQVKQIINDITALINLINQLNFQSCQVLNGIKAYIENNILKSEEGTAGKEASNEQASGSSEAFFSSIKNWFSEFGTRFSQLISKLKEETPPRSENGTVVPIDTSSILDDALQSTNLGEDTLLADLIRGILGDINPQKVINTCEGQTGSPSGYIPPRNTEVTEKYLTEWINSEGQITLKGMDSNGNPVEVSFSDIKQQIQNDIEQLMQYMEEGTRPPTNNFLYLAYSDIPTIAYIKAATAINDPDISGVINQSILDVITLDVVYTILKAVLKTAINETEDLIDAYRNRYSEAQCVVDALKDDIRKMKENYSNFMKAFTTAYWKIKKEREEQLIEFMRQYTQLVQTVYRRINEVLNTNVLPQRK